MIPSGLNPIVAILGNNEVTNTYKVDTVNKRIIGTSQLKHFKVPYTIEKVIKISRVNLYASDFISLFILHYPP